MNTTSTAAIYETLRTRALGFTPASGALAGRSVGQTLAQRFYNGAAPDAATYPYAIARIINRASAVDGNPERDEFDFEVMVYDRPRTNQVRAEGVADLLDAAFLRYVDPSSGLLFARSRQRDTLPQGAGDAEREVVQVRLLYSFTAWPLALATVPTA